MSEVATTDNNGGSLDAFFGSVEPKFKTLNKNTMPLSFKTEVEFAKQALLSNDYLFGVAQQNKYSLQKAITNVAAIGLSLNPANKHAYLLPRKVNNQQSVCLDISYMGMIKLATDTGLVEYMKAEIVYENDEFEYQGFDQRPSIKSTNPFDQAARGEIIGVIAWAKLNSGSYLSELMSADELNKIRDDSEAYKSAKRKGDYQLQNCVWVKYYGEMIKKTVIKRLYKTLPQSNGSHAMATAIDVLNEHEGFEIKQEERNIEYSEIESKAYKQALDDGDYVGLVCLIDTLSVEAQSQLWKLHEEHRIKQGGKGKYTDSMIEKLNVAREKRMEIYSKIVDAFLANDESAVSEIIDEVSQFEFDFYLNKADTELHSYLLEINNKIKEAA